MGTTILGSAQGNSITFTPPTIQYKRSWKGSWQPLDEAQFLTCDFVVCEAGIAKLEFLTRYGPDVKQPYETDIVAREPLDLLNCFVRVQMIDRQTHFERTVFSGKIYDEPRILMGNANVAMGKQHWQALGPAETLKRIDVSRSFWADGDPSTVKEIGWLPPLNSRDKQKNLVGNRSEEPGAGSIFVYGGKQVWNYKQYLDYILFSFVQKDFGPTWSIGGQYGILENLTASIEWGHVENVYQILKKLIPREYGLGFMVTYDNSGYVLKVFSLLGKDTTFGDVTIPANANAVQIQRANQLDLIDVRVVKSNEFLVDSFRVLGAPIVMCASLAGPAATDEVFAGESTKGWTPALEAQYIAGAGSPFDAFTVTQHDKARARAYFKNVYQAFTAPKDWDYRGGVLSPKCELDGTLSTDPGEFQNSVRSTLSWIPLRCDYDYTQDPPVPINDVGIEPGLEKPFAWLIDYDLDGEEGLTAAQSGYYTEVQKLGLNLSIMQADLGVFINASPNHKLALNHAFATDSEADATTKLPEPLYDYETLIFTIAWKCDQRLQLGFDVDESLKAGDGSRKDIFVENAELWLLAPGTVVGVNADTSLQLSGDTMRVLRNDTDRLAFICAGIKSRYLNDRVRAHAICKGHNPWIDLCGQILQFVEEGGGAQRDVVGAPITRMQWSMTDKCPIMQFFTGYGGG